MTAWTRLWDPDISIPVDTGCESQGNMKPEVEASVLLPPALFQRLMAAHRLWGVVEAGESE